MPSGEREILTDKERQDQKNGKRKQAGENQRFGSAYRHRKSYLRQMIESRKQAQTYENWELCIATAAEKKSLWKRSNPSMRQRIPESVISFDKK